MFKVFIPTDFSRNATNAIKYALNMSKKLDAKFILFHGGILPIPVGEMPIVTSVLDGAEIKAHLKAAIFKQATEAKFKLNEKRIDYLATEDFSLPPMITQNALKVKADLIIMGTKGASGIKKAFIGSNAVDVISRSHIPVLSVPNNYEYTGIKKILMPSDLKNLTGELREALPFAKLFNAQLQILFISDASEKGMKRYDAAV
ncbi:MAG: universal stress protein, partial [Chitinophagales bacterium]|nr:universal stress protein [Chitinophagales bacterium]